MSQIITMSSVTQDVIGFLAQVSLSHQPRLAFLSRHNRGGVSANLNLICEKLLSIEEVISTIEPKRRQPCVNETILDWLWLLYEDDTDIIPIYNDGVVITRWKPFLKPSAIPNIISFLRIDMKTGVEFENHGFGYHFHFGEIKNDRLRRSNLLFTFDRTNIGTKTEEVYRLYAENHGDGLKKDVSTIGINKRRPIYNICESEMRKRGLKNFREPSNGASVFFPTS